jgi:UDP-N-acetylglucosamine 2-epimerase (non-hydrolysing)
VLTDSGTVQEECAIFGVRNVTIRDVTERPETLECGSNVLVGAEPTLIRDAIRGQLQRKDRCSPPREYVADGVSQVVVNVLTSFRRHTRGS